MSLFATGRYCSVRLGESAAMAAPAARRVSATTWHRHSCLCWFASLRTPRIVPNSVAQIKAMLYLRALSVLLFSAFCSASPRLRVQCPSPHERQVRLHVSPVPPGLLPKPRFQQLILGVHPD